MKKTLLTLFIALTFIVKMNGQVKTDTIGIEKVRSSHRFYIKGERSSYREVKKLIKTDSLAFKKFKETRKDKAIAYPLSFIGGFLIGYGSGAKSSLQIASCGSGLIMVISALIIADKTDKKFLEAVLVYNKSFLSR